MRTEVRVGRPFRIPRSAEVLCHSTQLMIGDEIFEGEGESTIAIPGAKSAGVLDAFSLTIPVGVDVATELDHSESIEIVVLETLPLLRTTRIAFQRRLVDITSGSLTVDLLKEASDTFREAIAYGGRAWLTVYLMAANPVPEKKYPAGFWLSRAKFTFGGGGRGFQFGIHPLDEPQYEGGVPRKAATYLEIIGDVALDDVDNLNVSIYVNKDLLSRLSAIDSASSAAITKRLEVEVVGGLLSELAADCRSAGIDTWFDLKQNENSVGTMLIKNLAAMTGKRNEESQSWVFDQLMNGGLSLLRSILEAELDVLAAEMKSLSSSTARSGS